MIRPHCKDFYYDDSAFETMKTTLKTLKDFGADGFVFGVLKKIESSDDLHARWIDLDRNKSLVQLAGGRPCTFHRAFDCIPESCWNIALSDLTECGFASILTSGGPSGDKAIDCVDKLSDLVRRTSDVSRPNLRTGHQFPEIIIGGGVRDTNIQILWQKTHAQAFHSSSLIPGSGFVASDDVKRLRDSLKVAMSSE